MERLESKSIKGYTYYYYSKWARVDGKPRRVWQKYLGKLDDIALAVQAGGKTPTCADVFDWGLPEALWRQCQRADFVACVNRQCGTRSRGLSTGDYLAIATLNRAIRPHKRSLWQWFSQTVLRRHFPDASQPRLSSQRFWNHMDRIKQPDVMAIWQSILEGLVRREGIDLSSICYDGTNYYTFIDTFNTHCDIARRGKNKQGRSNLRQVSYNASNDSLCRFALNRCQFRLLGDGELAELRRLWRLVWLAARPFAAGLGTRSLTPLALGLVQSFFILGLATPRGAAHLRANDQEDFARTAFTSCSHSRAVASCLVGQRHFS